MGTARRPWGRFRLEEGGRPPKFAFDQTAMKNHEKWMELCALAAKEQDPSKLLTLTQEITRLIDEKEQRVKEIHRLLKEQEQLGKGNVSKEFDPTTKSQFHIEE